MRRPYVLILKDKIGKNEFQKQIYLEAEEEEIFLIDTTDLLRKLLSNNPEQWAKTVVAETFMVSESLGTEEERKYKKLKAKITKEVERSELERIESFERVVELYFDIFKKCFEEMNLYPLGDSDWAASITRDVFLNLRHKAKVMVSKSEEINHYFIKITDRTGFRWIFDPMAHLTQSFEEFSKQFEKLIH